jgi:hypothetical protein
LPAGERPDVDALTLDLFDRRGALAKARGDNFSGSDVVAAVIAQMANGPKPLQVALVHAHAELDGGHLAAAFEAARQALPPAEVYDLFSPYLVPHERGAKAKGVDTARQKVIIDTLGGRAVHWNLWREEGDRALDPRWLDAAVRLKSVGLVNAVGRPGHAAAEAFIQSEFDAAFKKDKDPNQVLNLVSVMVRTGHPGATAALLAAHDRFVVSSHGTDYWFCHLIPGLPKSAIPQLEAVLPKLKDRVANQWLTAIQELREKD